MRALAIGASIVLIATCLLGCSTAAKEVYGGLRGAKGLYAPIQPLTQTGVVPPLAQYTRFELGSFTDDLNGMVPSGLIADLRAQFAQELTDRNLPNNPAGKTLLIRGRILHYEDMSTLGMVLSPLEEVLVRAEMVDKDTGAVLGTANCIGRTTERINAGVRKKADGLAKALADWIQSGYPKAE